MIGLFRYLPPKRWWMPLLMSALLAATGEAQKINFGAYTTSQGLHLYPSAGLNFDYIIANIDTSVTVLRENSAWVQIDGDATRDITIMVPATVYLTRGLANQIPFACQYAYSNLGYDVNTAKANAIELSPGVTVITIPMLQRAMGAPPAPPPTPAHGGYTAPKATAYLFLYGTLGPVGNVSSGNYSGTVYVYINYTN